MLRAIEAGFVLGQQRALQKLHKTGMIKRRGGSYVLTRSGRAACRRVVALRLIGRS